MNGYAGWSRVTGAIPCAGASAQLTRPFRLSSHESLTGMSVFGLMEVNREVWAMAQVTHPAVAQVYGVASWRGRPFLMVEYLAGGTLADRLRYGPAPEPDAFSTTAALAGALAALHDVGYLHGDVKPSNIGFTTDGSPKLLDFGLVQGEMSTAAGRTLRYASPRVVSGRPVDETDDVWSLCVVLYEMIAGERPFAGDADQVTERIRRQRVGRCGPAVADSASASVVVAFAGSVLSSPGPVRPTTAQAFADALRAVGRDA